MSADVPLLEVRSLSKSFGVRVVDDLDLVVRAGDALGIVGPNGAGKTTVMHLVAGDLAPDQGSIRLDGRDITSEPPERRCRAGVARTTQVPRPFEGMTVFENVLVGARFGTGRRREREAVAQSVNALERTQLLAVANAAAASLTLLQRKRLELARALGTEPRLLLLDEIAGGLTEAEVQALLGTVRQLLADGITIVWIEHIVHALLAVVDRMVAMSAGRVIAEGEPADVMASPAVQEVYLGVAPA